MLYKLLPKDSKRRKAVKKAVGKTGLLPQKQTYGSWVAEQKDKIELFVREELDERPLVSVIVPAFNTPKKYLYPLIYSLVGQTYENWELIIVDASTKQKPRDDIEASTSIDTRLKIFPKDNEGISANTNFGIEKAKGEYIALVDHDDTLSPDALYEVVKAINNNPGVGLIYSDEDKLSEDGKKYLLPHLKPDWSPDLLTHVNYITHLSVIKKELIKEAGGLDPKKDGAQDYDLILKVIDLQPKIVHIPKVLYHWREAENSTAQSIASKPYIKNAGELALSDHYKRLGQRAKVAALPNKPGFYMSEFEMKEKPTVIIPLFANKTLVEKYLKILHQKKLLDGVRIILPTALAGSIDAHITPAEGASKQFIQKALEKSTKHVVFLSDFAIPDKANWARDIASTLVQDHIHAVSPLIKRQDGRIEDAGVLVNKTQKIMIFRGYPCGENTYFGDTDWSRNVDELTGAVVAVRNEELSDFLKSRNAAHSSARQILNQFSRDKKQRFNTILSTSPLVHIRSSQQFGGSRFMNPSIEEEGSDLRLLPNDKQLLDALEQIEEKIV